MYNIKVWNKLKVGIRNARSVNIFKKSIVSKKRKTRYVIFMIHFMILLHPLHALVILIGRVYVLAI